jgi:hypothetical protein
MSGAVTEKQITGLVYLAPYHAAILMGCSDRRYHSEVTIENRGMLAATAIVK